MCKRILIVEDELIIAEDIKMVLEAEGSYCCKIAGNYMSALDLFSEFDPHIIISDIYLKDSLSGLDLAIKVLDYKVMPVVFITSFPSSQILDQIVPYHNISFITKPFTSNQIITAVSIACKSAFDEKTSSKLSQREHQIVALLVQGKSNVDISVELNISEETVKTHRKSIFNKLDVNSVTHLINKVTCKGR
jgi:DNA-binding NarL/FixJ family response regulator